MNDADTGWKSASFQNAVPDTSNSDGEINIGDLLRVLWRGKYLIALFSAAFLALALLYLSQATSLFTARAQLIVDTQGQSVVDLESVVSGISSEDSELNSQIEVIRSRMLIGRVVDELNLMTDPEFVPSLEDRTLPAQALHAFKTFVRDLVFAKSSSGGPRKPNPPRIRRSTI